jgi:hypothetical protein
VRRVALIGTAALAATGLVACESTQDKSARLSKNAKGLIKEKGSVVGRENPDIRVEQTAIVQDSNGVAAVVRLRNRGGTQAQLPVTITVSDAKGRKLYRNDIAGLEPALVSVPVMRKGEETYWVNNQILVAGKAKKVVAKVGTAKEKPHGALPQMEITKVHLDRDEDGVFARGIVANKSDVLQKRLTIFCVASKGGKIVAAGRAVIDKLPPAAGAKKPTAFTVYFIGDPRGAKLTFAAPPTVLAGGAS